MIRSCFVTGTDVAVGKTLVASALVNRLRNHGVHTVGMKPVATGATLEQGRWRQSDLEQLAKEGSFAFPGRVLSPYIFAQESAPQEAAQMAGVQMRIEEMVDAFDVLATWADVIVVETTEAKKLNDKATEDAKETTVLILVALGITALLTIGLGSLLGSSVLRDVGGEPSVIAEIAHRVAAGDLRVEVTV